MIIATTVSIGIDQSYTRTCISVTLDGDRDFNLYTVDFSECRNAIDKRLTVRQTLLNVIHDIREKVDATRIVCIFERIRLFSANKTSDESKQSHISPDYMFSTGKLVGIIIDTCYECGITCYSVDTRCWKSAVLGSSKTDFVKYSDFIKPEKGAAITFALNHGIDVIERDKDGNEKLSKRGKNKGKTIYNDDLADSYCISKYAFTHGRKLLKEE